jgi:hypothetical protein
VEVGGSPLLTTKNESRKQEKNLKRDSCLAFTMSKDSGMTGKIETVGTLGSGKLSGFGLGLLKGIKPSTFKNPDSIKQAKEN